MGYNEVFFIYLALAPHALSECKFKMCKYEINIKIVNCLNWKATVRPQPQQEL